MTFPKDSLRLYLSYVPRAWWALFVGTPAALAGWLTTIWTDIEISKTTWIWFGVALLGIAQFQAFHRLFREKLLTEQLLAAEKQKLGAGALLTGVHPLDSAFSAQNYRASLHYTETGLLIRCVVARRISSASIGLTSPLKNRFLDAVKESDFSGWVDEFADPHQSGDWSFSLPTDSLIATISREGKMTEENGNRLKAEAVLQTPSAPFVAGWFAVVLDLVVTAETRNTHRHLFRDLGHLMESLDTLLRSSVEIAAEVLQRHEGEDQTLMGPSITVQTRSSHLDDWILFPEWDKASGSTSRSFFAVKAESTGKADTPGKRNVLIRESLARMVADEGFLDYDEQLRDF